MIFDAESILDEEIEQGIGFGGKMELGLGIRRGIRALRHVDKGNWWSFPGQPLYQLTGSFTPTNQLISDFYIDGSWNIPPLFPPDVRDSIIKTIIVESSKDSFVWLLSKNGDLTSKDAYSSIRNKGSKVLWGCLIWHSYIQPAQSMLLWCIILNRLPTDDNLKAVGMCVPSQCSMCHVAEDGVSHLFFNCKFANLI
ncbi:hypothetical protein Q3G72_004127 [Acer saccharum]|nr:hypothetical protein Q3G72_004127 [Acer saccharum]